MHVPGHNSGRWLEDVPGEDLERLINAAPGREIATGKFDSPRSSARLAVNAFGYFFRNPCYLPPLPDCEDVEWPATSVNVEQSIRFPWQGGRHPWLDALISTPSALIGVESKRFEPFGRRSRNREGSAVSSTYWRAGWGDQMEGYQEVRNRIHDDKNLFIRLDAAQLFKHALALRTEVNRGGKHNGLTPILFYVYAEPAVWPESNVLVDEQEKIDHRQEIARFAQTVVSDEVRFVACSYRKLLTVWQRSENPGVRSHAEAVDLCFQP